MILGLQNRLDFLFIAWPSVKRADDLKGKKVAIGTPLGTAALATYVALDHLGLVPKRDNVVLLQLGDVPERVAALRAGNVEAASLSPELAPLLTAEGYRVGQRFNLNDAVQDAVGHVCIQHALQWGPHGAECRARIRPVFAGMSVAPRMSLMIAAESAPADQTSWTFSSLMPPMATMGSLTADRICRSISTPRAAYPVAFVIVPNIGPKPM